MCSSTVFSSLIRISCLYATQDSTLYVLRVPRRHRFSTKSQHPCVRGPKSTEAPSSREGGQPRVVGSSACEGLVECRNSDRRMASLDFCSFCCRKYQSSHLIARRAGRALGVIHVHTGDGIASISEPVLSVGCDGCYGLHGTGMCR